MLDYKNDIAIIIPSLDPDDKLISLLVNLNKARFKNIIILNDGSSEKYDKYFNIAESEYNCKILKHAVNQGKGRALKTAINYILTDKPNILGVVTVDSDGQHTIEDIEKCCTALIENPEKLIMGCRNFFDDNKNIPLRSKFGNIMTHKVLKLLCGIDISDTQTGLRGFSRKLMPLLLNVKGERFEYEMNMLLDVNENGVKIKQVPIKTVYIEENSSSHFNPLLDSLRIYAVFSKFIISSFTSFIIDIVLFSILTFLLKDIIPFYIMLSAYTARAVSAVFNYTLNKNKVFKSNLNNRTAAIRYIILCVAQITISAFSTKLLFDLTDVNVTFIKIIIDIIIFMISFRIQKNWVFKKA